jgi:nuclear pore complex protein Nup160
MNGGLLVAAQLSSLFPPTQVTSVPLQTSRRNTPLPPRPTESDPPVEHALFSTVLHTPTTGTILMRVIHGGLILELISLSSDVAPVRFVFPAPVLSSPAIFLWESYEVHVIAVTSVGSLYRLVLPGSTGKLWHDQVTKNWCREHLIQNIRGDVVGVVHVQGVHTVAIGLHNGAILRLETESLGDENHDGEKARSSLRIL